MTANSMAKKRKAEATRLDEVDRTMYASFRSAASSLSQLYTHAMSHQRLSFQAGERHASEKLYQWILRKQEEGSRVPTVDIIAYLQNELDYGAEEPPLSPRLPFQQQHSQTASHLDVSISSTLFTSATGVQGGRSDQQAKHNVFSNSLASPVHRSIQNYHLSQGAARSNDPNYFHHQNRDTNSPCSNDSFMDMNGDSPSHDFPQ